MTPTESTDNSKEQRSREVGSSTPGGKRDAIRTRRGIVGTFDGRDDSVKVGRFEKSSVDFLTVVTIQEFCSFITTWRGGATGPDLGPVVTSNFSFSSLVQSGDVGR